MAISKKRLGFNLMAILLMVIFVEAGLHIANFIIHLLAPPKNFMDTIQAMSLYRDKEWVKDLVKELDEAENHKYEPFIEWRGKEYHGKYVNVDAEGLRKTWNPDFLNGKQPQTIYMFGGSSLWGWGARDEQTIPSHLSKFLNDNDYLFLVKNYGERAYTLNQEIVRLIFLLKEGHKPDYVLFYDGYNDVESAYQSGTAGGIYDIVGFKESLESKSLAKHLALWGIGFLEEHSRIYKTTSLLASRLKDLLYHQTQAMIPENSDKNWSVLSNKISIHYLNSMLLVDHLSKAYGFQYLCFWQPTIYSEKKLTKEESRTMGTDTSFSNNPFATLYTNIFELLQAKSPSHFYNISNILENRIEPYYLDESHLTEDGNEIVANKISRILEKDYLRNHFFR